MENDDDILTEEEFEAATRRGEELEKTEPRGESIRFDRRSARLVINLKNGSTFAFPARFVQGLEKATDAEIAAVEIDKWGYGLRWEKQDIDISIPGLLSGIFGTQKHMARLAGQAKSPAKATAARANGAKGGRPRKSA